MKKYNIAKSTTALLRVGATRAVAYTTFVCFTFGWLAGVVDTKNAPPLQTKKKKKVQRCIWCVAPRLIIAANIRLFNILYPLQ